MTSPLCRIFGKIVIIFLQTNTPKECWKNCKIGQNVVYWFRILWRKRCTTKNRIKERNWQDMRVLGIDPGYAIVGWGVVDYEVPKFTAVDYGAVTTPAGMEFGQRLKGVHGGVSKVIELYKPDAISLEQLFYQHNQTTVIGVAEARGVVLLAAAQAGVPVYEYTPMQVKQSVTGYGKAVKKQVQEMTRMMLKLPGIPKPDDTADALAMAITHAQCSGSRQFDVSSLLQRAQGPVSGGMTRLQQIEKTLTAKKKR